MAHSLVRDRHYAADVFAFVAAGQIQVVVLTQEEARLRDTLPSTLGMGERESIAIAKERGGTVLSNESRVAYYCRQFSIPCVRLPAILRALWVESIVSHQEVRAIIEELQVKEHAVSTSNVPVQIDASPEDIHKNYGQGTADFSRQRNACPFSV